MGVEIVDIVTKHKECLRSKSHEYAGKLVKDEAALKDARSQQQRALQAMREAELKKSTAAAALKTLREELHQSDADIRDVDAELRSLNNFQARLMDGPLA